MTASLTTGMFKSAVVDREGVVNEGIAQGFRPGALLDIGRTHGGQIGR